MGKVNFVGFRGRGTKRGEGKNKKFSAQNASKDPCDLIRQSRDRKLPLVRAKIASLSPCVCEKTFLAEPKV